MSGIDATFSDSELDEVEPDSDGYTTEENIDDDSSDDGKLFIYLFCIAF